MNGSDDAEGVLENLTGAGVDHGPLKKKRKSNISFSVLSWGGA
jgi:hypothetical protein